MVGNSELDRPQHDAGVLAARPVAGRPERGRLLATSMEALTRTDGEPSLGGGARTLRRAAGNRKSGQPPSASTVCVPCDQVARAADALGVLQLPVLPCMDCGTTRGLSRERLLERGLVSLAGFVVGVMARRRSSHVAGEDAARPHSRPNPVRRAQPPLPLLGRNRARHRDRDDAHACRARGRFSTRCILEMGRRAVRRHAQRSAARLLRRMGGCSSPRRRLRRTVVHRCRPRSPGWAWFRKNFCWARTNTPARCESKNQCATA
jgi:hypothetical protein